MTMYDNVEIPYGAYWSTPFAKWQGSFAHLHSIQFAAHVAKRELLARQIDARRLAFCVLGATVPQYRAFWGAPWLMSALGAPAVGGPTVSEACATGTRSLCVAANMIAAGEGSIGLVVGADRISSTPHVYYPAPHARGGVGQHEDWAVDAMFGGDPSTGQDMLQTAENVARRWDIGLAEQHAVVLRRYEQYQNARASSAAFQRRYMTLPFAVPDATFSKTHSVIEGDEGVFATTREGLTRLKPVQDGGTVTYASQTHPADGNAGLIVVTGEHARDLSRDPAIQIKIVGFGAARAEPALMPAAPVGATRAALRASALTIQDMRAIKSHNPFALNDIVFAKEFDLDCDSMNNYGCSLIFGHPHAATAVRQIIELIEELVTVGGGYGLFHGCAAGDMGMAAIVHVGDRRQ